MGINLSLSKTLNPQEPYPEKGRSKFMQPNIGMDHQMGKQLNHGTTKESNVSYQKLIQFQSLRDMENYDKKINKHASFTENSIF